MNSSSLKTYWKKFWQFFWHEDSLASWVVNIIVAFLVIRFLVYPLLGVVLGTGFPIVAVLSESMEHGLHNGAICGQQFDTFKGSFDQYWDTCGAWYQKIGITKEQFAQFPFKNGFNKGDVIVLGKADPSTLAVGDVLVFAGNRPQPIIHRIVRIYEEDGERFYHTKGDHNAQSIPGVLGETKISEERLLGKGLVRLPYLGWVKILFVDFLSLFGITITT